MSEPSIRHHLIMTTSLGRIWVLIDCDACAALKIFDNRDGIELFEQAVDNAAQLPKPNPGMPTPEHDVFHT